MPAYVELVYYDFRNSLYRDDIGDSHLLHHWMKSAVNLDDCPLPYSFCDRRSNDHKGMTNDKQLNYSVCNDCGQPLLTTWPNICFMCEECGRPFTISRYPVQYELCMNCGGDR